MALTGRQAAAPGGGGWSPCGPPVVASAANTLAGRSQGSHSPGSVVDGAYLVGLSLAAAPPADAAHCGPLLLLLWVLLLLLLLLLLWVVRRRHVLGKEAGLTRRRRLCRHVRHRHQPQAVHALLRQRRQRRLLRPQLAPLLLLLHLQLNGLLLQLELLALQLIEPLGRAGGRAGGGRVWDAVLL